jgi:hypothetical protein
MHFADSFHASGDLLDVSYTLSTDGLTMTRMLDFKDKTAYDNFIAAYAAEFPTARSERDAYETANGQIRSISTSSI